MKLLIDANLSPVVADELRGAGHDAVHVADLSLGTASDEQILDAASRDARVVISADADFGALLAVGGLTKPSFVLLRSADHLTPTKQAALLIDNLTQVEGELEGGAIASISRGRMRVRTLPVE